MPSSPGSQKRVRWTVTNDSVDPPVLVDPSAQTVTYGRVGRGNFGTPTTLTYPDDAEIVHDGTGTFHLDIVCDQPGTWAVEIKATAGIIASDIETWEIAPSPEFG